jgi:tRNA nucleotidyltransferase (CCA-adding enzyme)
MKLKELDIKELRIDIPSGEGMGIPRKQMPQIKSGDYPEFIDYLADNGASFTKETVPATSLKPVQKEFSKQGVEKQIKKLVKNGVKKPVIASSDDYIMDGHHRWLVALNTRDSVNIYRVNKPGKELLDLLLAFPKVYFKDIYNEEDVFEEPLVAKQSHIFHVVSTLADRKDNQPFPIKFYDGGTMDVKPSTAKRIIDLYYSAEDKVKAQIMKYMPTYNGFREIAKVAGAVQESAGVGKITKQNTTADVKPGETERQAKKFFPMNKNGKPKPLGIKGATPNQAFNLGMTENISVTGTERGQEARKKKLRPGSEAWFKHWFSLPLMKRESFEEAKRELQQHLTGLIEDTIIVEEIVTEETLDVAGIITPSIKKLDTVFNKNKYEIRIVGGAVRDIALGKSPKDIDMATDATPDEMIAMLDREGIKHIPTGIEHGTITAVVDGEDFEITTLRADSNTDGRRAEVEFVRSWEEDAKRRDLTYNAMSMDIDGQIYDYHNGMDDLQDKVSKFVGDPAERIQEDYLRILRYFRFQGRMENPTWDKDTVSAIADNASGLSKISAERVWMEMQKILGGKNVASILQYIKSTGVADVIGLTVDNLNNIQDDADPIIQLAKLGNPAEIARRWKMTNINAGMLEFLVTHKDQKLDKKQIEDMIADGVDKEKISALATLQGNTNMASHATSVSVPEFPVTGKDLIAKGMKPGLELGQKLAQLKTKWKQSNFKATKDDLLNEDLGTPVDWEFIVAVALAAKMTPFAVKAMWKTAKGAYKIKKFADKMGIKMSKAVMGEDISRNDVLAKFKTNQRERYMDAMLGAMHKLVQSKGKRHDISNYAFEIAKSFNFNPRQLEKLYREKYGVTENFADGKVKGKSRPGRVKRSGASCNGSVTELRAKAKKASGEKAKMYHWCANMKAGKK